jgi:transcriptional regulator with XRE-family HTH domain
MMLARRIRELRYAKGWSTIELAGRANISRSALCQLERGATNKPHAETLNRVSRALGVPLEVLLAPAPVANGHASLPPAPAPAASRESPARYSSTRVEELVEMFAILLSSPMAEALARIVEEASRLVPIIPPRGSTEGLPRAPHFEIPAFRRGRGRPSGPD